jgi:hypothetical protein
MFADVQGELEAMGPAEEDNLTRQRIDVQSAAAQPLPMEALDSAAPQVLRHYPRWTAAEATAAAGFVQSEAVRYWNPLAIADPEGRCRLSFTLPERETTFRIAVDAHGDGRIGSKQTEIVVRKAEP